VCVVDLCASLCATQQTHSFPSRALARTGSSSKVAKQRCLTAPLLLLLLLLLLLAMTVRRSVRQSDCQNWYCVSACTQPHCCVHYCTRIHTDLLATVSILTILLYAYYSLSLLLLLLRATARLCRCDGKSLNEILKRIKHRVCDAPSLRGGLPLMTPRYRLLLLFCYLQLLLLLLLLLLP
jgi:hypothetical protein